MIVWLVVAASAQTFPELDPEQVRPVLVHALGCKTPAVEVLTTVWELPGTVGWALAACRGAPQLVVLRGTEPGVASEAWPIPLDGKRIEVHGFLDLAGEWRDVQEVGSALRLSAGPHGQARPGLLVGVRGCTAARFVLLELGAGEPAVLLDAPARGAAVHIHGKASPPTIEVVRGAASTTVPLP